MAYHTGSGCGSAASLIEQQIGEAYKKVATVADNIEAVTHLSTNIEIISTIDDQVLAVETAAANADASADSAAASAGTATGAAGTAQTSAGQAMSFRNEAEGFADAAAASATAAETTLESAVLSTNNGSDFEDPTAVPGNIGAMPVATYDPNAVAGDAFDSGNHSGFTAADVATKTIPANVDEIRTNGYAAPGDGGDAAYVRQASDPGHEGKVVDAAASIFAILNRTVKLSQFNCFPSETVSQHQGFIDAWEALKVLGGGEIIIDKDEPYLVQQSIFLSMLADFAGQIIIWNKAGGVLKGGDQLDQPLLLTGVMSDGVVADAKLITHDVYIDVADTLYAGATSSSTGLSTRWFDYVHNHNLRVTGSYDPVANTGSGDSGHGSVGCRTIINDSPVIKKMRDTAFYPSWDNSGASGGYVEINNAIVEECAHIVTAKRNLAECRVNGGTFRKNRAGIATRRIGDGGASPDVKGGRRLVIDGALIEKTMTQCAVWSDGATGGIMNSIIRDIGYLADGTGNVSSNAIAILDSGALNIFSKGNTFEMVDWASVAEFAYSQSNASFTDDFGNTTEYIGGGIERVGNTYRNWSRYHKVATGQVGRRGVAKAEIMDRDPYVAQDFDAQGDPIEYTVIGEERKKLYANGIVFTERAGSPAPEQTIDLSFMGTLASGQKYATQQVVVAGLTEADRVDVQKLGAFATFPATVIDARCYNDGFEYTVQHLGTASTDMTGREVRFSFSRE